MGKIIAFMLALVTATLKAQPALAHAALVEASPRGGSVVSGSPAEVRLTFSESIEPRFSGMSLTAASGPQVWGRGAVDPGDRTQMVLHPSRPLPPGVYRVNWHVLSGDSHQTQGSFTFEVRP